MGSNTDYLNDLESFLDNPSSGLITSSATSPHPISSPMGPSTPISNGAGVRDRLRHHLNGAEKRKLEDGSTSELLLKTQRTDDHHLLLDSMDHVIKNEDVKSEELDLKEEPMQPGYGGHMNQGGLLAQALMEKRPNQANGHLNSQTGYFGSPNVTASRNSTDIAAFKLQVQAISKDPTLNEQQRNAKMAGILSQNPQLQRILMATKNHKDKLLRRSLAQETLMQRDQMVGSPMMQPEYGPGFPSGGNGDMYNNSQFIDNPHVGGLGGPPQPGPRGRGRTPLPQSGPGLNNLYPGPGVPIQSEMWDMGGKCMPGQMPPQQHIQPPPQYPYRQPGPRQNNMMNPMGGGCYNQPQGDYMPQGMYGQQQPYVGQRGGMPEPLYTNDSCGPNPVGVRGFNPTMYSGGGMRMGNPYSEGFQNDYIVPPHGGRNLRHPEFMYPQQQHHRMGNQQPNMTLTPQQQQMQQQRGVGPGFAMSPRIQGNIGQMSPVISPPMHSPAGMQMSMPPSNSQHNVFNNNNNIVPGGNNSNSNNNAFNVPGSGMSNGFNFNDDYLGPSIQSPGLQSAVGMMDEGGMDSILGLDESVPNGQFNGNWKLTASELRNDLLQRIQTALKDSNSGGCIDTEASAIEEEAFNISDTQETYVHRLAQWLASKFSSIQEASNPYPDSTTVPDTLSCSKLSSSTDASENSSGDMLAKANPILAETLAAANDEQISTPVSGSGELKDNESFSSSSSSSASTSPASSTTTTTTSMPGLCSPMTSLAASKSTTSTTTTPTAQMRKNDTFHRPTSESVQTADKGIQRAVNGRRPSGKGSNSNNNNPHSVDSGIGSPRSTTSSSLYSPKLHGTSPSLAALSNSEPSPGKLS